MKNSFEISKTLKVHYTTIVYNIKKLGLIPVTTKGTIKYYDDFQINLLFEILTNKGLVNNNLRTVSEIASITGTTYEIVIRIIEREGIKPIKINPYRLNENQQDIIFMFLYFEKRCNYLIYPSKLNDPNFDCPEVYSREDFISAGHIIRK